jgi:EmrB/QacA subfamily drug resistance transporter
MYNNNTQAPGLNYRSSTWIALLVAASFFMENLDTTIITTAVPQMALSFGVAAVDLNIGVSAYMLALGVFIPASGWVAERFGARTVFASAIVVFTLSSLLCGTATGLGEFVVLRVLQGMGGAMMVPVGRLTVLKNTPKERLIAAIATLTWPAMAAPVLGPPVGGFITTYASWRWIFYLNLPLGVIAAIAALWIIPNDKSPERRPFDWPGFLLGGSGIFSTLWAVELIGGPDTPWGKAGAFLAAGIVLLTACAWHLRRAAMPMIDVTVVKVQTFAITIMGGSLFRMAVGATTLLLPLLFQVGFGMNPFHSGLLMIAIFSGNLAIKPATTHIIRRWGFKPVLLVNGVINAVFLGAYAFFSPDTPIVAIIIILFIGGLTRSLHFTAVNTIAFADVPDKKMRAANTLFSTAFQLSLGMGVAVGALASRAGHWLTGQVGLDAVPAMNFRIAFVLIALLSLLALVDALWLPANAGELISKRRKA